jgi:hypothetical protein
LTIAQITQEVAGISAQYSGPYGVPISVAGAGIAGILRGIHAIQVRSQGFDFSLQPKRALFVSSLCTYDNVRFEVENLINPEERTALLKQLHDDMIVKVELFTNPQYDSNEDGIADGLECPYCRTYRQFFDAKKKVVECFKANSHEMEKVRQQIDTPGMEWNTCILLAAIREDKTSGTKTLEDILKFAPDEVASMKEWMKTLDHIKNFQGCMEISDKRVLQDINHRSLAVLDNLAFDSEVALNDKMEGLIELGETVKMTIPTPEKLFENFNPVDYVAHSLAKIDWAQDELVAIDGMANGGSAQIQREINELNLYLRETFFSELSPQFLEWHIDDAMRAVKEFKGKVKQIAFELEQNELHKEPPYVEYLANPSLPGILQNLKNNPKANHPYVFSRINELVLWMGTAFKSMRAVQVYCDYFGEALTMSGKIYAECSSQKRSEAQRVIDEQEFILTSIHDYLKWAINERKVDLEPVKDLVEKVTKFRKALEGREKKVI